MYLVGMIVTAVSKKIVRLPFGLRWRSTLWFTPKGGKKYGSVEMGKFRGNTGSRILLTNYWTRMLRSLLSKKKRYDSDKTAQLSFFSSILYHGLSATIFTDNHAVLANDDLLDGISDWLHRNTHFLKFVKIEGGLNIESSVIGKGKVRFFRREFRLTCTTSRPLASGGSIQLRAFSPDTFRNAVTMRSSKGQGIPLGDFISE